MSRRSLKPGSLGLLFCLAACIGGVLALQWPRLVAPPGRIDPVIVLPRPEAVQYLTFGYRNLLADWYWLDFVQYFGDIDTRRRTGYARSAEYLQLVTALNPAFLFAYAQANFAVAEMMAQPKLAIAILEAGAVRNPGRPDALGMPGTWYLYRLAGSVAFRHFGDYGRAARFYALAASQPAAPAVMKDNAAAFYQAANDSERAIRLWREFYYEAPLPELRAEALRHLKALGVEP